LVEFKAKSRMRDPSYCLLKFSAVSIASFVQRDHAKLVVNFLLREILHFNIAAKFN